MIIVMKPNVTAARMQEITAGITAWGLKPHVRQSEQRNIIDIAGEPQPAQQAKLEHYTEIERIVNVTQPFKLASREWHPENTTFTVGENITIGGPALVIMAGPCAVENRAQILETARAVKARGAHILRGGAFKPRTSPYSFQGLGEEGLKLLAAARAETGLPIITEVIAPENVALVAGYADILQIGSRNMQNFALLNAVGKTRRPVLLKRGLMATLKEFLMAAEYILAQGNQRVILCERGIRTFETYTRNTLDINAIPLLKQLTHLPVIVDPSHSTGKWELVEPVSRAAIAAGADGIIVEVHPAPKEALSDGQQSLKPERFGHLVHSLRKIAPALGRTL